MAERGVWMNCGECGEARAHLIAAWQTQSIARCDVCSATIDIAHAYRHAPWCVSCGEDVNDCVCEERFVCDQCGAECGLICRACAVCPEPAGYWAWDRESARDYLIALERAAARESDPGIAQTLIAHHAVMTDALGMSDKGAE